MEETGTFKPEQSDGDVIPNGDMENSSLPCYTENGSKTTTFWGSGNNGFATSLCSQSTFKGMGGNYCAKLEATMAGVSIFSFLAAGNLFTATFEKPSTKGFVRFGQDYTEKQTADLVYRGRKALKKELEKEGITDAKS